MSGRKRRRAKPDKGSCLLRHSTGSCRPEPVEGRNTEWYCTTCGAPWKRKAARPVATSEEAGLVITSQERQRWRGFGGCFNELGWKALSAMPARARRETLAKLFAASGECQLSFCRVPIGASDYAESWYSLDEVPGDYEMRHFSIERDRRSLIPYIKAALELCPQMQLFASPWSPPTWMKSPPVYNCGRIIRSKANLRAYARYFLAFVRAYAAEGIAVSQVHVQNEPMSSQKFPSCVWTGEELREFIADYLGPLFERESCPAEIWLGTLNGPETDQRFLHTGFNDYANLVLSDPRARRHVRGIAYQWAGKHALQRTRLAWPEVPLIQSENECGDGNNTWAYAFYVFDLFHHYLVNDVEAYVYWNMVLAPGGESSWGWRQNALFTADPGPGDVAANPEYHVMRHFAQFIRPGYRRLHVEGRWAGNAVAFRGDGRTVVVVRNPFRDSARMAVRVGEHVRAFDLDACSLNTLVLSELV